MKRLKDIIEAKGDSIGGSRIAINKETIKEKQKRRRIGRWICVCFIMLFVIGAGVLWVPELLYRPATQDETTGLLTYVAGSSYEEYMTQYPNEDPDNDGIPNLQENTYGTSPFISDTDQDGILDYAEINVTKTDPLQKNSNLLAYIKNEDAKNNEIVKTPYKIGDVILWADDYESKAYGSVCAAQGGYYFFGFRGWVQFDKGGSAYVIEDASHELLEYREKENAWRIDNDCFVILEDDDLERINEFTVHKNNPSYLERSFLYNVLEVILPDHKGLLVCRDIAIKDTWEDSKGIKSAPLAEYKEERKSILNGADGDLQFLADIYASIDAEECVPIAIRSGEGQEAHVVVYGYDNKGNLIVRQGELDSIIAIEVRSQRCIGNDGTLAMRSWFEFSIDGIGTKDGYRLTATEKDETGSEDEVNSTVPGGVISIPTISKDPTPTPTVTPTNTPVPTQSPSRVPTNTPKPTQTIAGKATVTPTKTATNPPTPTPSKANTPTPTKKPSNTPRPTATPTTKVTPSLSQETVSIPGNITSLAYKSIQNTTSYLGFDATNTSAGMNKATAYLKAKEMVSLLLNVSNPQTFSSSEIVSPESYMHFGTWTGKRNSVFRDWAKRISQYNISVATRVVESEPYVYYEKLSASTYIPTVRLCIVYDISASNFEQIKKDGLFKVDSAGRYTQIIDVCPMTSIAGAYAGILPVTTPTEIR